jgi:hypothetical protein
MIRRFCDRLLLSVLVSMIGCTTVFSGCSSDPPATQPRAGKEIKADSDRFFEKMKQEERERGRAAEGTAR